MCVSRCGHGNYKLCVFRYNHVIDRFNTNTIFHFMKLTCLNSPPGVRSSNNVKGKARNL